MEKTSKPVVITKMQSRSHPVWTPMKKTKKHKRLYRTVSVLTAVCLCMGIGVLCTDRTDYVQSVMSHVTADFEYDDTLGRLQFVSNILPESAMVFLSNEFEPMQMYLPTSAKISHAWSQEEPWLEYACIGDVAACQAGEIMTIVQNRQGEYTVRVLHDHGYESVYSGLSAVHLDEHESVAAGQQIGTAAGNAAFELRKDGLSVLPVFSDI